MSSVLTINQDDHEAHKNARERESWNAGSQVQTTEIYISVVQTHKMQDDKNDICLRALFKIPPLLYAPVVAPTLFALPLRLLASDLWEIFNFQPSN
jgi:hypothetical protein